jgi:hypothetical protein
MADAWGRYPYFFRSILFKRSVSTSSEMLSKRAAARAQRRAVRQAAFLGASGSPLRRAGADAGDLGAMVTKTSILSRTRILPPQ